MRIFVVLLLLCSPAVLLVPAQSAPHRVAPAAAAAVDVYAVVAEVDRIASQRILWPDFDPRRVPVEIYDGHATLLFRHPKPPEEFVSLSSRRGVWAFPGRHETVTANAPVKLGGVLTATVMLHPASKLSLRERAALVIHEMFHVHQRERHPKWSGNELELFTYPFEDAELLALRRIETESLRRAERAADAKTAACRARLALATRRERFARLSTGASGYERALELNEGLARYVEALAAGARRSGLTANEYPAEELRTRGYATGHALALLLERFAPGWTARLEAGNARSLDELLAAALANAPSRSTCALSESFAASARSRAKVETETLNARRETSRRAFAAQAGWKIVVNADAAAPLWPQDFDPLNVRRLGATDVLHTRHLKLGNDAGAIESFHPHMLTVGAGAHPLFNGVRQLTIAGLAAEPSVREAGDKLTLEAAGIKSEFRGARLERAGQTLTINLSAARK
ncbi:MAG TPA: hypothetical protein VGX24_09020 [Pyrinomonadaceae bacterium]|jgi:hypothetical protein|nr:hypothetical protein [Pyrinomonadaceae bacterium]